jgi:hypothetical protein
MATVTKSRPRSKSARFCKIARVGDAAILVIRQSYPRKLDILDTYTVEAFPSDCGGRGVELTKVDGTRYHVNLNGKASTCSCPGFESHGWHIDRATGEPTACKHIMALLKLEQNGKL